jgi:hypothetical protein
LKNCHKYGKRLLIRTVLTLIENCYLLNFNKWFCQKKFEGREFSCQPNTLVRHTD